VDHVIGRRTWFVVPAAAGMLAVAILLGDRGSDGAGRCRMLLVPAYVPPEAILELARAVRPGLIVINPASGPGAAPQVAYRAAVRQVQAGGGRVLGYVPTGYGARDPGQVGADIDRYASWYGTDGIFLDEVAPGPDRLPYYRELAAHVRAPGERLVVLNPGTVPDRAYFDIADVVVTFEGAYGEYAPPPDWIRALPAERVAALVYGASREQAADVLDGSDYAGYVYVTSGTLPHPWGTVPAYIAEERAEIGCGTLAERRVFGPFAGLGGKKADPAGRHAGERGTNVAT
jgi:hypothetical protein